MKSGKDASGGVRDLLVNRDFNALWFAMLLSTAGTFFLLLALSVSALERVDSALGVSGVFASQWFLALFAPAAVTRLCARYRPRYTLPLIEGAGAFVTLGIALTSEFPIAILFLLLLLRGYLDAITKSIRTVALRLYLEGPLLERAASLFNTSYYMGGAAGALIGTLLIAHLSIPQIALLNAATHLIATLLYLRLGRLAGPKKVETTTRRSAWTEALETLRGNHLLLAAFGRLCVTAAVFQGFHNVARTVMPLREFGMPPSAVTMLQFLASTAILFGALFVTHFLQSNSRLKVDGTLLIASTSIVMIAPLAGFPPITAFAVYFVFIFLFEVAFTKFQKDVVVHCPAEHMPAIASTNHAVLTLGITVTVLAVGALADAFGLLGAAVVAALAATVANLSIFSMLGRAEGPPIAVESKEGQVE